MNDQPSGEEVERLLDLILNKMPVATNRDLAVDGPVGNEEGRVWDEIVAQAHRVVDARIDADPDQLTPEEARAAQNAIEYYAERHGDPPGWSMAADAKLERLSQSPAEDER